MNVIPLICAVAFVLLVVFAYVNYREGRKGELYAEVSEKLGFLDESIKQLERWHQVYFAEHQELAADIADARGFHDDAARSVRGQLGMLDCGQLEDFRDEIAVTEFQVHELRALMVFCMTREQRAAEGLN